jgi:hypothetical protein
MTRLVLTLNPTETRLYDARTDRLDLLGYSFGLRCHRQQSRWFTGATPSNKSVRRLKDKIGACRATGYGMNTRQGEPPVAGMVRLLQAWNPLPHGPSDRGPFVRPRV